MSVENWENGQGLTWSGKWHIMTSAKVPDRRQRRALCGASVYTYETVPRSNLRLLSIARGVKTAPVCKLCARAAAKP